jgi:peptide/nickel transport system ATP-binding protein
VQLEEGLVLHRPALDAAQRRAAILRILDRIGLHDPAGAMASYPHQFSGGMRQRIMLASVMLLKPALLIADEPTTALDSMVQNEVLDLMLELTREDNTAVLMISHDLPMVARYTQRIVVMEKGRIVETGPTAQLLDAPQHPYTRKLLAAMPRRLPARPLADGKPLVEVKDLVVDYQLSKSWFSRKTAPRTMRALHGIDLTIRPREVVAVVGGSGSGKTTLGRIIAGLLKPTEGSMHFDGSPVIRSDPAYRTYRHNCQMVFQDPYSSLDPRMNIGALIAEGMGPEHGLDGATLRARVAEALSDVELDPKLATRFPHELSGGQRQRVAIARALIRRPAFVIADEAVSALDMTVRAKILELFAELQRRYGFACLFISHDLGVVEQIADRVVVMHRGRIVEQGLRDTVFDGPQQDYTRALLGAVPKLVPTAAGGVSLQWRDDAPATRLSTSF